MSLVTTAFGQQSNSNVADAFGEPKPIESDAVVEREAAVDALTRLQGTADQLVTEYEQKQSEARTDIRVNGSKEVERNRARQKRLAALRGATSLDGETIPPEVLTDILITSANGSDVQASEELIRDSLEDIAIASEDGDNGEVLNAALEGVEFYDPLVENYRDQVHQSSLLRIAEEHGFNLDQGIGPGQMLGDFAHIMALPLTSNLSRGSDVITTDERGKFIDLLFSGNRFYKNAEAFKELSREEQIELFPALLAEIRDNLDIKSTFNVGGFQIPVDFVNRSIANELIAGYIFGIDKNDADIMSLMDAIDTGPAVAGSSYGLARASGRTITMARLSGAKKAAQEITIKKTQDLLEGRQPNNVQEYVDETLPTAVNPNKSDKPAEIPTEGVNALDVIQQMDEVATLLNGSRRPTELLEAHEIVSLEKAAKKKIQKQLKRKVYDIRTEFVDEAGVSTPVLKVIVGGTKGGYKTPLRMLREAKKLGLNTAHVRIRDNSKFNNSRVLSAEEAVSDTIDKVEKASAKYDVRPENDSIFDAIVEGAEESGEFFLNPTKAQLNELADIDVVNMVATPEGNTVAWLGRPHANVINELGISRADVGQGFYNPKSPQSFSPDNPLDSIHDNFVGSEGDFNLRRTNAPAKPEDIIALERRYDTAVDKFRQAEKKYNFATMQTGGGEKLQKTLSKRRKELDQARKELENTSAALDEAVGSRDAQVVQKDDGLYYLELETPFITREGFTLFDKQTHATGPFARWLLSNHFTSDLNNLSLAGLSEGHRSAFLTIVRKFIAPQLKKLQRREKRALDDLATRMRDERRWFSDDELTEFYTDYFGARTVPQRWYDGVQAYRTASDLEYYIRNSELFNRASIEGFQTIGVDFVTDSVWTNKIDEQNAKLHRTPPSQLSEGKVYDANNGTLYSADNPYNASDIGAKGNYIVEFQEQVTITTKDGQDVMVKHIVADPQAVYARSLERAQLPYLGGGSHIIYGPQVRTWVKQAQTFTQGDGSGTILRNPRTYVGGTRPSDVNEYVTRMNDAIDLAKRFYKPRIESERIKTFDGYRRRVGQVLDRTAVRGLMDRDTFIEQVANHMEGRTNEPTIDIDHYLEIVDDRQNPKIYEPNFVDNETQVLGGHESWARSNGRTYYGPRGQRMLDASGEELPVLGPFEAMDRALNNVARIAGMSNYQARTSRQFLNTFEDVLAMKFSNNTNPDVQVRRMYNHINDESLFRQGADAKRVTQAKNQLASVGRIANWDVPLARQIDKGMIKLANSVDAMSQNNLMMSLVSDTLHWSMQADFSYGLRQMAFDIKLGLGAISQLPMQISTAIALSAVDPKATAQAFLTYPVARAWLYGNPMDGTLNGGKPWSVKQLRDYMSSISNKTGLTGDKLDNWVSMMDSLRNSDFLNLQGHTLQGDMSMAQITGIAPSSIPVRAGRAIRDLGRIPFNEAEIFNRIVGYQVAWRQMGRRFPTADKTSQAFQRNVIGMADELTLNMRHHARAANQSGLASGFTQFMAYPSRWIEMMFSLPGNNSHLTRFQRSRFILSQLPLYGYGGFWLTHMLSDWLKKESGESPSFNELGEEAPDSVTERVEGVLSDPATLMERGALDALYYIGTGQDHRYADRAEVASFLPQLFNDFIGNSKYGDTSAMEFLGGASVSIGLDVLSDAKDVMWAAKTEGAVAVAKWNAVTLSQTPIEDVSQAATWNPITGKEITELLRNVSSVNNYMRYQGIKKTGELRSKNGLLLASDLDDMDAISALWGIPVQEQDMLSAQMEMLNDRSGKIDTAVRDATYFRSRYMSAVTPEERDKWLNMYAHYLEFMVPDHIRGEVAQRATRYDIESMLESTSRRVQEIEINDTFQRAFEEELERRQESESN